MGPLDSAYRIVPPLRMDGLQKMDPASGKGKKMEWLIRILIILCIALLLSGCYLISYGVLISRQILGRILIIMSIVYGYMALRFTTIWI